MRKNTFLFILFTAALALTTSSELFSEAWWDSSWKARRQVRAFVREERTPDGEVAWCTFYTMGMVKADGSDVRVVAQRKLVPHKVLCVGPGDTAAVAFKLIPNWQEYYIYFGNPKAEPPEENWEPKRGLLLETRKFAGGAVGNAQQLIDTFKRGTPVQGAAFIDAIFLGHNLFGDSVYNVSKYTGWFEARQDGKYSFVISSDDGSALFLDGNLVVQWPGWHGAVGDIRFKRDRQIAKGLHKVEFYHVQGGGAQIAVVAWQPPGLNKITNMGKGAFLNVQEATMVRLERYKENVAPDFVMQHIGEAFLGGPENKYLVRIKFANASSENVKKYYKPTWDFGDGTTSTDIAPEHIYLAPGPHRVTLTMRGQEVTYSTTNNIIIDRDWPNQIRRNIDDLKVYSLFITNYDFAKMNAPSLANAMELFDKVHEILAEEKDKTVRNLQQTQMTNAHKRAARFLLYTDIEADDAILLAKSGEYAARLMAEKKYDEINQLYLKTYDRMKDPKMKAEVAIQIGNLNVFYLHKYKAAENFFNKVISELKVTDFNITRKAYLGLGDAYRFIGDRDKCEDYYKKAAAIDVTGKRTYAQNEARKGGLSRMIEDYIRLEDHETATDLLDTWLWEYPLDRLSGYASILIAKNCVLVGQYDLATNELLSIGRVDPKNNYADEALFLAAQYLIKMRKKPEALELLKKILVEYPETPDKTNIEIMVKELEAVK